MMDGVFFTKVLDNAIVCSSVVLIKGSDAGFASVHDTLRSIFDSVHSN